MPQPPYTFWRLRNFELFENIPSKDVERIGAMMSHSHLKKNDVIYAEGDNVQRLYLLKEGRIKILQENLSEEETITGLLQEGDIFGRLDLDSRVAYESETAIIASERAFVCSLETKDLEKLIQSIPQLAINYSRVLAERLKMLERKYALFLKKDIRTRLTNFFVMHSMHEGRKNGNGVEIQGFLTHKDIAHFIGTSRQTATTLINEMEAKGLVRFIDHRKISIPDIEKLKKF